MLAIILAVSVLVGVLGAGVGGGADSGESGLPHAVASDAEFDLGSNTTQSPVIDSHSFSLVSSDRPNAPSTPPEDKRVVVHFEDDHVVTEETADEIPPDPAITVDNEGAELIVDDHDDYDLPVVQTTDGEVATVDDGRPIHRVEANPDLVVFDGDIVDDEIEVDRDSGEVQTVDGGMPVEVEIGGELIPVVYSEYETIDLTPEIVDVADVDEGDQLSVTTEITNSRWADADSVDITLRLLSSDDELETVTESVDIDGNEQIEETLDYETESGDYRADAVEIEVDDETDSEEIEIGAAGAAVSIRETNTPIEGSDLVVTANINRYGDIPEGTHNYPISLFIDGTEEQTEIPSLSPGESTTETFRYETGHSDVSEVEVEASSRTDSSTTTVPVISQNEFEDNINTTTTDTTIGELGEDLTIDTSFTYDDDLPDGETEFLANLSIDGSLTEQRNITLDDSSSVDETFVYDHSESDPPVRNVSIETPGGTESVEFDRGASITFEDVTDPVARNESMSGTVTVENTGETPGQDTLTIDVLNSDAVETNGTDELTTQLNPGESTSEEFEYTLTDNAPPQLEISANTTDAVETTSVEVRDDNPQFEIDTVTIEETSDSDSNLTVSSMVQNVGGVTGTQDITIEFDNDLIVEEEVTLEPDEQETFTADVAQSDAGTYSYTVTTEDDSVSDTTTIDSNSTTLIDRALSFVSLDGLVSPLMILSVLGLALVGAVVIKHRTDPDGLQDQVAALQPAAQKLQSAARNIVSNNGTGTVIVKNDLPREALVRIRVRSADENLFIEDFELAVGERRTIECLPENGQFAVGCGVDDITAHEETFLPDAEKAGVVLRPNGITIGEL